MLITKNKFNKKLILKKIILIMVILIKKVENNKLPKSKKLIYSQILTKNQIIQFKSRIIRMKKYKKTMKIKIKLINNYIKKI
jgi:hypothetical protein